MRLAIVVSSPMTARCFLQDQLNALAQRHDVTLIANYANLSELGPLPNNLRTIRVDVRRQVSPFADLKALFVLWRIFRLQRFHLVHSITPKAGLLAMLAGFLARVPNRIHTFTGQVWATRQGVSRVLLRSLDRLIFRMTTRCFVDSESQRDFLIRMGVVTEQRSSVLANGSISGVDINRFAFSTNVRRRVRRELGIGDRAFVALYLGRLNKDKGILDLAQAFARISQSSVDSILLLVGPDEDGLRPAIERCFEGRSPRVVFVGFTDKPENYMSAADLFCLPSYREGFGSAVIEAAAVGIPALGSDIYGVSDAILDGQTGVLHEAANIDAIRGELARLRDDEVLRREMGNHARERAKREFAKELVTEALIKEYEALGRPS